MRTFVGAPLAMIGVVAFTASQVLAQAAPPRFNGSISVGSATTSPGDIVLVSTRDGNPEIYSVNADGTNLRRLTNSLANDDAPAWSPDGKRIAFVSDRDGSPEIYVMNADGTNVVRRTFSASYSGDPCWSADGTRIVYSTLSNGSLNIWTVSADSGSPALLLEEPGYDAQPALSPDGSKLAVVSDSYAYDSVYDIFIANADGTGWTTLTDDIFDHVDYVRPSWSPDGAKLAVAITQTTGVDQFSTRLGVINADGSGLTPLISAATWAKSSWSPDGTIIAFTSGSSGALDISWVSATDGNASGTIVTNGYSPDWRKNVMTAPGPNLLIGGDFEMYVPPGLGPGWLSDYPLREIPAKSETHQPRTGAQNGACWTPESGDCGMYQDVTAPSTGTYTLTIPASADRPGGLVGANVNGALVATANIAPREFGVYETYVSTFTAMAGDTIRVWMYSPSTRGYVVIDDVNLTAEP